MFHHISISTSCTRPAQMFFSLFRFPLTGQGSNYIAHDVHCQSGNSCISLLGPGWQVGGRGTIMYPFQVMYCQPIMYAFSGLAGWKRSLILRNGAGWQVGWRACYHVQVKSTIMYHVLSTPSCIHPLFVREGVMTMNQ